MFMGECLLDYVRVQTHESKEGVEDSSFPLVSERDDENTILFKNPPKLAHDFVKRREKLYDFRADDGVNRPRLEGDMVYVSNRRLHDIPESGRT